MKEKAHKALSRLIIHDRIRRFYYQDHRSIRWIARETNPNFRTVRKYPGMNQMEFENFTDHIINRVRILESYKDFIVQKLSLYQEAPVLTEAESAVISATTLQWIRQQ